MINNYKNEYCKDVEIGFEVITNMGEDEIVEEELVEKEEVGLKEWRVKIRVTKLREESPWNS